MDCENLFCLGALFTSPRRTQARTHFAEFLNMAQHQPSILIRDTARCLDMVVQYKQRTLLETFMLSHFRYLCAANTAYTCGPKIFRQFCPINSDCLHSQMILNIFCSLFTIKWIHSLVLPYEAFIHFYFSPEKETALLENFLFLSTFI